MQDDPMIGREWAGYVVQSKIGEGGMGAVYLLVHQSLPDKYKALKVLNAHGASVASAKERFEQEARVAAALGKNRVAEVVTVGAFSDGIPYIVMEFIPGRSLADHLEETGPLRVLTALQIAYGIADTLGIAHGKQIVHRDIKPSNIMLTRTRDEEFAVTILDWGIAKARGEYQVAHTVTTAIAGTLGYMAPEVVRRGGSVDGRADVFSLGVLLYKVLSGVLPFPALTSEDQIPAFIASRPPSIGQNRPPSLDAVPRWLERIVLRALAPLRDERPTMDELREELAQAMHRVQLSPENNPSLPEPDQADHTERPTHSLPSQHSEPDDATKLLRPQTTDPGTAKIAPPQTQLRARPRVPLLAVALLTVAVPVGSVVALRNCGSVPPPNQGAKDLGNAPPPDDLAKPVPVPRDMAMPPVAVKPPPVKMGNASKPASDTRTSKPPDSRPPTPPRPVAPQKGKCRRNAMGSLVCD